MGLGNSTLEKDESGPLIVNKSASEFKQSVQIRTWHELVGCTYDVAEAQILEDLPGFSVNKVGPEEDSYRFYFDPKIDVCVDENDIVIIPPTTG